MKTISVILIGAGRRGTAYTNEMLKNGQKFKVVGVADPIKERRDLVQKKHGFSDDMCFNSWEDILAKPKMADLAIIATMDDMHYEPALKAIELGYDLLLEKPLAQTAEECANISLAAQEKGVKVLVCHVLRYTPFFKKIKQLLMDGAVGKIMSVIHVEGVGNLHQSHSFVRGNWHSESETAPMLLAKCCHDIDILQWLLDKPCKHVQSFGSLTHFRSENAPAGAPIRCIDGGCPVGDTCPYNCRKLYYESDNLWFRDACTRGIAKGEIPTDDEVMQALTTTDYGLCVYHANNDVVDHQTVNMEFESGATVTLHMTAFAKQTVLGSRRIRIMGTKGDLIGDFGLEADKAFSFYDFKTCRRETLDVSKYIEKFKIEQTIPCHPGDTGIILDLYDYLTGNISGEDLSEIEASVKNHMLAFAAEDARLKGQVIDLKEYLDNYLNK